MSVLGERLRELRQQRKMTQFDVARYLGITDSAYGYYEQGRREPSMDVLLKLSSLFGVTVDYLLGKTDDPHGHAPMEIPDTKAEFVEWFMNHIDDVFFEEFSGSSEEQREALREAIEFHWEHIKRLTKQKLAERERRNGNG